MGHKSGFYTVNRCLLPTIAVSPILRRTHARVDTQADRAVRISPGQHRRISLYEQLLGLHFTTRLAWDWLPAGCVVSTTV